ncbi:MAG: NAD(P)-dependent oxidoreductase [Candidatus Zipacnadales bacterium]
MKLGFAGMGIMGAPMSLNLLRAGHDITVWNRTSSKCEPLREAGAKVAMTLHEIAQGAEIVFICVSDTPDVEALLFGKGGLAEVLETGQIVVDHSTISPEATVEFARRLEEQGVEMLDAPVSGGQKGAIEGTLAIMCGGKPEIFERVRPALEVMGKNVVHCGPNGNGQRVKAVNQVICALNILAIAEGLLFAKRAGLDLETVYKVVSSGAAASWLLSSLGPAIIRGDWEPGFTIRLQAKDLRIASQAMEAVGAPHEGTTRAARLFGAALEAGFGEKGTQAIANFLGWYKEID